MNDELVLKHEIASVIEESGMAVTSQKDYVYAGNVRKDIKEKINQVKAYWEPKKNAAFKLHKDLVAAEKEIISPLEQADKLIDGHMGDYRREVERVQREVEAERRRLEQEVFNKAEEARKMAEELSQKEELDDDDIEILKMAQEDLNRANEVVESTPFAPPQAFMKGISVRKTWKARIIYPDLVPIKINGLVLRPVDEKILNRLAVDSKGGFLVPGVEFYQEESTQVRLT